MNKMLIFFLLVFMIYIGCHIYVFIRGLQAFDFKGTSLTIYLTVFICISLLFLIGMIFGDLLPLKVTSFTQLAGGTWLFAVLYISAFCVLLDIIRFSNYLFHWYPSLIVENYPLIKKYLGIGICSVLTLIFVWSSIQFNNINIETLHIDTGKNKENTKIVMVSDIHLGYTITKKDLKKFVELINSQNPDLVLIAGDLVDRSIRPLIEEKMHEELNLLKTKLGVYAILGNHEYINNLKQSKEFIENTTINLLRDTSVTINDELVIIGRDDRMNSGRKSIQELTENVDKEKILILMDHQPHNLEEAERAGIDLQLSGHTHHGQMWPVNLITKLIYELSFGYLKKGNTHYYVSSGLGIWGPRLRLGSQSEIVVITIK